MTTRFTSGGVGRFTFETANKLLDAADRAESMPHGVQSLLRKARPGNIMARLRAEITSPVYFEELDGFPLRVFDWIAVRVGDGNDVAKRKIEFSTTFGSAGFGDETKGLAVCVNGGAKVGDVVNLFPLGNACKDARGSERWFGFIGTLPASTQLLYITQSKQINNYRHEYFVDPYRYSQGSMIRDPFMPSAMAINLSEFGLGNDPYNDSHGQQFKFPPNGGSLEPTGPIAGFVIGKIISDIDEVPSIYAFDVRHNVKPACEDDGGIDPL